MAQSISDRVCSDSVYSVNVASANKAHIDAANSAIQSVVVARNFESADRPFEQRGQ
jgi:hypothetical protein